MYFVDIKIIISIIILKSLVQNYIITLQPIVRSEEVRFHISNGDLFFTKSRI